ncbi:MAG: YdjY domain-containing protein [Planctomycetota bacterium]
MPQLTRSLTAVLCCGLALTACAPTNPYPDTTPDAPSATAPPTDPIARPRPSADPTPPPAAASHTIYPGVVIDRQRGHLDLRGRVVGRAVDWLELLACRPGTREHEAIVTLDAEATHIQLALILLGLEPGTPARAEIVDSQVTVHPPQGPAVELFFVLDDQPAVEVPANRWVIDQDAGKLMPGNRWLFVGSRSVEHAGQTWFLAEQNGTLVSLVNFGDELIGRPTLQSEDGGNVFWTANTPQIPAEGTRITLRIRPAAAVEPGGYGP